MESSTNGRSTQSSVQNRRSREPPAWLLAILSACVYAYYSIDRAVIRLCQLSRHWMGHPHVDGRTNSKQGNQEGGEPDIAIGPILARSDAPGLFNILESLSAKLGGSFPTEVRLSYLPACGVLDLGMESGYRRQVLIIGLPCFLILRIDELQAVLAHELAHLQLEHNRRVRAFADFGSNILQVPAGGPVPWDRPRCYLARFIGRRLARVTAWVSHAMEYRADEVSANCFGTRPLASALEKLAIVQPLFRETLLFYDPMERQQGSVYKFFATFWKGIDRKQYKRLRRRFVKQAEPDPCDVHPPVHRRIHRLTGEEWRGRRVPASAVTLLAAPEELMAVMHNRLYGEHSEPDSVFQRFPAGKE